ncbi:MAG: hypothetical protein Q4B01_08445 [Eubacteriales bacterium]|nr:hypothetical protein [Eubacteriales bacterium]
MSKKDELTGALIGLAKTCGNNPKTEDTAYLFIEGLAVLENSSENEADILEEMIEKLHAEKYRLSPGCANCTAHCGNTDDFDLAELQKDDEEVQELKLQMLQKIRKIAVSAREQMVQKETAEKIADLLIRVLAYFSYEMDLDDLLPLAKETEAFFSYGIRCGII